MKSVVFTLLFFYETRFLNEKINILCALLELVFICILLDFSMVRIEILVR